MILHPPDHHAPRNEQCPHNADPACPCSCKREQKARARRLFRRLAVTDRNAPQGIRPALIIEVHPSGLIVLREKGRRTAYQTTAGNILRGLQWQEARAKARKGRK